MPAANDLCVLADVKARLRITGTTEDAMMGTMITQLSEYILEWLSRPVAAAAYIEYSDGNYRNKIPLKNSPINSVSAVKVDGLAIPQSTSPLMAGWFLSGQIIYLRGYDTGNGFQNVEVSYNGGFATVPPAIAGACIELVCLRYKELDRIGISSKSIGPEVTSFVTRDMPDSTKSALLQYRRTIEL